MIGGGVFFIIILFLGLLFMAPFPHWRSYILICRCILTSCHKEIPLGVRLYHIGFLLREILLCPIYTLFWYIDELLFPAYRNQPVANVIFIIGQPRSGTTLLHRVLGADEDNFLAIKHLEWRYPFICLQSLLDCTGLTAWFSKRKYWPNNSVGSLASKMHPHQLGDYEEDGVFFEERFYHHYFVFRRFPYPELMPKIGLFSTLSEKAQAKMLAIHRQAIQKVIYRRGSSVKFIVLKENESMTIFPKIQTLYPNVTFIGITRKTRGMLNSYMQLSTIATLAKTGVDPNSIFGWKSKNIEKRKKECDLMVEFFKNNLPIEKQLLISYDYFIQNIPKTIKYIYNHLNIQLSKDHFCRIKCLQQTQESRNKGYSIYDSTHYDGFNAYNEFVEKVAEGHRNVLAGHSSHCMEKY